MKVTSYITFTNWNEIISVHVIITTFYPLCFLDQNVETLDFCLSSRYEIVCPKEFD